jgi:phosphatidylglycerophosphate synthase
MRQHLMNSLLAVEVTLLGSARMTELSARRPLTSRSSLWAAGLARTLARWGVRPNQVSVASSVFAGLGAASLLLGGRYWPGSVVWVIMAVCIQMRLVCNLMDGMLAIEGGLKSANGGLFNEFPDRLSDVAILAALGYAGGSDLSIALGWMAACGALMTACVRMHGASLTGEHDFRGPMAKPQRMALATGACLMMAGLSLFHMALPVVPWVLGGMCFGLLLTVWRRLSALSHALQTSTVPTP